MELSKEQREAVESDSQFIAILAAAGSGKTRTLTERICHLIQNKGVKSEEILALTFTSKAANEMKHRVINNIGDMANGLWIKTFHSYGLQLLRMFPEYSGLPEHFEIIDAATKNRIIKKILHGQFEPEEALYRISEIKNGIVKCDKDFDEVFTAYNNTLKANEFIDLDDMLWNAVRMIRSHDEVKEYLHNRFKHVLIDEFQDTNQMQFDLINLGLSKTASLCIVGDDDQCIYEWRGSKPELIRDFAKRNDVQTIHLSNNYRSQKYIVKIANEFITKNLNRIFKKMFSKVATFKSTSTKPQFFHVESEEDEAKLICKIIEKECRENAVKYNEIAVLVRSSKQISPICSALRNEHIPYTRKNDEQTAQFISVVQVLNTIIDCEKNNNIARGINFPNAVLDNFTYMDMVDDYHLESLSVIEVFEFLLRHTEIEWENSEYFRERYKKLKELNEQIHGNSSYKTTEILHELQKFYMHQLSCMSAEKETRMKYIDQVIAVCEIWEQTAENTDLVSFTDYLVCALENEDEVLSFEEEERVNVITCHKAKGLEYPVVIIPGVQIGIFPNDFFIHTKAELEQERRLFYVAMTRAIDTLYITNYNSRSTGNDIVKNDFVSEIPELINWRSERLTH